MTCRACTFDQIRDVSVACKKKRAFSFIILASPTLENNSFVVREGQMQVLSAMGLAFLHEVYPGVMYQNLMW